MTASGLLVVIEGIDYSGKTTQTRRLVRALEGAGRSVSSFHFPTDASDLGKFIRRALSGGCSLPDDTLLALFAANRLESRVPIQSALLNDRVVVCDRYCPSEYAYGAAKGLPLNWLEALESRMPPADITYLLDLDVPRAAERSREGAARDMFEEDHRFLEGVRQAYLNIAKSGGKLGSGWVIIDAGRTEDAIADQLFAGVFSRLRDGAAG
jgi:dTMP kinase